MTPYELSVPQMMGPNTGDPKVDPVSVPVLGATSDLRDRRRRIRAEHSLRQCCGRLDTEETHDP